MLIRDNYAAADAATARVSVRLPPLLLELDGGFSQRGIRRRKRTQYLRTLCWKVTTRAIGGCRRLADIAAALLLIVLLSPLMLVVFVAACLNGGGVCRESKLGRWAKPFSRYTFSLQGGEPCSLLRPLLCLPSLLNILMGDMAFIGPRPVSSSAVLNGDPLAWKRFDSRPGLLSLWRLRKRANIAYESEAGLDVEYVETCSLRGDIGIAVRAIPTLLFAGAGAGAGAAEQLSILGVRIDNLTMEQASRRIVELAAAGAGAHVCFINADCFNIAAHDHAYRATLAAADLVLADGIGVRIAGSAFRQRIRENINGTDMLPYLTQQLEAAGKSLYLLGGRPGVAEAAAAWIRDRHPLLRIAGLHHGFFSTEQNAEILHEIRSSAADVLLVAMGAPRQEMWIAENRDRLTSCVSIGVGGLLDFYSGRVPRAPVWMRELSLEWLYRFTQEPRRMWRRYFVGNVVFLWRVAWQGVILRKSWARTTGLPS